MAVVHLVLKSLYTWESLYKQGMKYTLSRRLFRIIVSWRRIYSETDPLGTNLSQNRIPVGKRLLIERLCHGIPACMHALYSLRL